MSHTSQNVYGHAIQPCLKNVVSAVQGQLSIQHSAPDAECLQEEPEAVALIDAVDEEQHLALHQAQLQQHHHVQQLVFPGRQQHPNEKLPQ